MTYPQTQAQILAKTFDSKILKNIGDNGCLALCVIEKLKPGLENIEGLELVAREIGKSLDKDCTVIWKDFVESFGKKFVGVRFLDIRGLDDIKDCTESVFVRFDKGNKSHWVLVEKGKPIFNSLVHSECVEHGKATKVRILSYD